MKQILIIEDAADIAQMFAHFLESKGYDCEVATGGQAGIRRSGEKQFDLVIADLMMPGVSGFEVAETVRKRDRLVPMLLVTGKDDDVLVRAHARRAGFNEVLFKPVAPDALLEKVESLTGNGKS